MTHLYPFAAIVGYEQAKKALLCVIADENINTVLIMGDTGTAKSTLARSVGSLIQDKKVLTIPQNATYDRMLGNIDLETAVCSGNIRLSPGILEQGNGQILYADDINLMDKGMVSHLLSVAETGQIIIEREGFSHKAQTRFILIATMDPEEGELSPAQMDRFDLCIRLDVIADPEMRSEIVKKNLQFEHAAGEFIRMYEPVTGEIRRTLLTACELIPCVNIPEGHADLISSLCLELGVAGQRGDIAVAHLAKALAALDGRESVVFDDVKLAALFTLEHRRRDIPNIPPPARPQGENEKKGDENDDRNKSPERNAPPNRDPMPEKNEQDKTEQDDQKSSPPVSQPPAEQVFEVGSAFDVIRYLDEKSRRSTRKQKSGRRTRVVSNDSSGHYRSFRLPGKNRNDIAIDATLRAAAPYQGIRESGNLAISVKKSDLREKVREKKVAHTILFLVDTSGSMGVRRRMVVVKGAILSLLTDAYQKRDRIGLMIFRGSGARLLLPPTRSPDIAAKMLRTIPTGGMTPLTKGISDAYELLTRGKYATVCENKSIVLLTDGRVNVSMNDKTPAEELADLSRRIAGTGVRFVVVDTEEGFPRIGRARKLAGDLEASYYRLEDLNSRRLAGTVQELIYPNV